MPKKLLLSFTCALSSTPFVNLYCTEEPLLRAIQGPEHDLFHGQALAPIIPPHEQAADPIVRPTILVRLQNQAAAVFDVLSFGFNYVVSRCQRVVADMFRVDTEAFQYAVNQNALNRAAAFEEIIHPICQYCRPVWDWLVFLVERLWYVPLTPFLQLQ
jgi:hypothetical protein